MTDRTVASGAHAASTTGSPVGSAGGTGAERSTGEIISSVTQDITTLVRQELDLAKTELKQEAGRAGKGAGLLAGAGVAGHFVLLFVSLTIVFALDLVLPLWASALIVAVTWAVVAAVLASVGKKAIQESNPQLPKTQQTLKEDASWAKAQKS